MRKFVFFLSVGLIVFFLSLTSASSVAASDKFWSTPEPISNTAYHAISPQTVTDSKGYFHSVWMEIADDYGWGGGDENSDFGGASNGIYYSFWNGDVWSTPERISQSDYSTENPAIAVDSNDNLYIVWQDSGYFSPYVDPANTPGSWFRIIMCKKPSGTAGCQSRVSVSQGSSQGLAGEDGDYTAATFPSIAVDSSGKIHVVYSYRSYVFNYDEGYKVYYTSSSDQGSTWSVPQLVGDGDWSDIPSLRVDSADNLHLAYETRVYGSFTGTPGIKYRHLTAGTSVWSDPPDILSTNTHAEYARIAVDGDNNAYVVWDEWTQGTSNVQVKVNRRDNVSGNFSTPFVISNNGGYSSGLGWSYPITGVTTDSNNNVYVGWGELVGPEGSQQVEARYRRWSASGTWPDVGWSAPETIRTTSSMDAPYIYKDKWDNQHFVWTERNISGVWETWYSVVPANVEQYDPASKLTMVHPVTGDKLVIPAGALAASATVSAQIGPLPASYNPAYTTIPRSYTYRPHGTTFINGKVATATIYYNNSEVVGSDERNMKVYVWDGATSSWSTPAGTVNTGANKVTIDLNHFSLHGVFSPKVNLSFASPGPSVEGATIPVNFDLTYVDGSPVPAIIEGLEDPQPGSNVALVLKDSSGNVVHTVYSDSVNGNQFSVSGANYQVDLSVTGFVEGDYTLEVLIGGTLIGSHSLHLVPPPITVSFRPPLSDEEVYTMVDDSTLPVKFILRQDSAVLLEPENVTVEVEGISTPFIMEEGSDNIRFDPETGQYILNLHTKDYNLTVDTHTITVLVDNQSVGTINFELLDGGKVKGKGY